MEWYYEGSSGQAGPVSEEEFQSLIKDGVITYRTLVWNSTMADWKEYGKLNAAPDGVGVDKAMCAECGRNYSRDDMIKYGESWVCAQCKPVFVQKIKEGVTMTQLDYAGFWIRLGAWIIDYIIVGVVNLMISIPFLFLQMSAASSNDLSGSLLYSLLSSLLNMIVTISYGTVFIGKWGATLGKMACGLKVVNPEGEKITYLRAFARVFAKAVNWLTLFVGYIMVAFDEEKQGLHDRICSTRVIRN